MTKFVPPVVSGDVCLTYVKSIGKTADIVSRWGISFGVDRIYDVMEEMNLFDTAHHSSSTRLLFVNFGGEEERRNLELLQRVRTAGIPAEIYPDAVKMKKQMGYADSNGIPYVALAGSEELKNGVVTVKEMKTGNQEKLTLEALIEKLK